MIVLLMFLCVDRALYRVKEIVVFLEVVKLFKRWRESNFIAFAYGCAL